MNFKRLLIILAVVLTLGCFAVSASAETVAAPAAPVIESSNVASSGKIRLEWDAVDGAAKYKVYRATSVDGKYILMKTLTGTSYVNSTAVAGKKYYYYVVALDDKGNISKKSNKVSRVCDLAQPSITSITNVAKTGKIEVKWSAVEGAAKYKLYRSTSKNGTYTVLKTTTDLSYINNNAAPGTLYYYKVKAIHDVAAGHSAFSAIKTRTCDLAQPVVTAGNILSTGKIKLTWNAVDGAQCYKVYRSTSKNGTYTYMKTATGTTYTNTSAKAEKCYYYKVRAISSNSAANSAYSSILSRTCDLPRPSNVKVALNSNGKPKLTWDAVEGATEYKVYRSTSKSGEYTLIKTTTARNFTNTSVKIGATYYYKVKAVAANTAANSSYSLVASVSTRDYEPRYVSRRHVYAYVEPSSSTEEICLTYMTEFELGETIHEYTSGSWYKIRYQGKIYYMWVAAGDQKFTDKKSSFVYTAENPYAQEVIDKAMMIYNEWDTHYVSGATGQTDKNGVHGFDCTGFATYCVNTVMQKYNPAYRITPNIKKLYDLNNIYNDNIKGEFNAKTISLEDIQPGDFIFLAMNDGVNMDHAAIYLGNGELMHMMGFYDKVIIMPLEGYYAERICRIKRYIPEELTPANKTMYSKSNYVKMYSERGNDESHMYTCTKNEKITVLYTYEIREGLTQAYCSSSTGKKGFIYIKNLSSTKV